MSLARLFIYFASIFSSLNMLAQEPDSIALVKGTVSDFENNSKIGEVIIFENTSTHETFETFSGEDGYFEISLPYFFTYQIKIKGFSDDVDYIEFSIPALKKGQKSMTYQVDIKFEPAKSFTLSNVHFESGRAALTEQSYNQLNELIEFMKLKKTTRIEIGGHTDSFGDDDSNMILSQKRAETVRNYLVKNGIEANRVVAVGYGEAVPVKSNDTEKGRQENRRTEVKLLN